MKHKPNRKKLSVFGLSTIETMIVVSIAGLILVVVAGGASQLQKARRDNYRRAYARSIYAKLEEFNKNNRKFPGCRYNSASPCNGSDMKNFLEHYMPEGKDPSTGKAYNTDVATITSDSSYGDGKVVKNSNKTAAYMDNGIHHYMHPKKGEVVLGTAHWCYSSQADPGTPSPDNGKKGKGGGNGPPMAGEGYDEDITKFVILMYQERGAYYCLDNFTGQ